MACSTPDADTDNTYFFYIPVYATYITYEEVPGGRKTA
jgi:hypothetical protein